MTNLHTTMDRAKALTVQTRPSTPPPSPPSYIKAASYFSPRSQQCCQCNSRSPSPSQSDAAEEAQARRAAQDRTCIITKEQTGTSNCCGHKLCRDCPRRDSSGNEVIPHSFPVDWVCSTCGDVHSVLDILTMAVGCGCGKPTLQAVYDQFGRIFLYWRDDPAVYDLTDPAKVQEAAWRVWEAGSEPWLPVVLEVERRIAEEAAAAAVKGGLKQQFGQGGPKLNHRFSQSSLSSKDSLDIEMAEVA